MKLPLILCRVAATAILLLAATAGHASERIEASSLTNPAPREPFSAFERFELTKFVLLKPYAGQAANEHAMVDAQADLDRRLNEWVSAKNAEPARSEVPRVLLIEPRIEKVKFIGGSARFWAGAFAGSSRVLIKVKFTDKATGTVIAEPEFYQHASGMAGAWTFGAADKAMLERVTTLIADYVKTNYGAAVGGPTGMESSQ